MSTWELLARAWDWEPSVVAGCGALLALYFLLVRPLGARALLWVAGVLMLLLSLVSPIDVIGDTYLFSVHMFQHLLMTLVVVPLLLLGIPREAARSALRHPVVARAERLLGNPFTGLAASVLVMYVWHLPALYDAALRSEGVHVIEHLMFLATSAMFWWPVIAPAREEPEMGIGWTITYLFGAMAFGSGLGILLAFAPAGFYAPYRNPADTLGALPLIRDNWGISLAGDQQLGGLLMWIPGGVVYSLAVFGLLARWFSGEDEDDDTLPVRETTSPPTPPLPGEGRYPGPEGGQTTRTLAPTGRGGNAYIGGRSHGDTGVGAKERSAGPATFRQTTTHRGWVGRGGRQLEPLPLEKMPPYVISVAYDRGGIDVGAALRGRPITFRHTMVHCGWATAVRGRHCRTLPLQGVSPRVIVAADTNRCRDLPSQRRGRG